MTEPERPPYDESMTAAEPFGDAPDAVDPGLPQEDVAVKRQRLRDEWAAAEESAITAERRWENLVGYTTAEGNPTAAEVAAAKVDAAILNFAAAKARDRYFTEGEV